jgi:hypothetical protein
MTAPLPSFEALEAAHAYLRKRLGRPPFPPDIWALAGLIDRFYAERIR